MDSEKSSSSIFPIRRADRALPREDAERILREAEYGTLAMCDVGNAGSAPEPYGVPVSFVFWRGAIWIHSADDGRKFRILSAAPRVHFSCAQNVQAVFTRFFTTRYESAMLAGTVEIVSDAAVKRAALRELCRKYLPEKMEVADEHISNSIARTAIFRIVPEFITAKAKH